jgi:hypothetical protein
MALRIARTLYLLRKLLLVGASKRNREAEPQKGVAFHPNPPTFNHYIPNLNYAAPSPPERGLRKSSKGIIPPRTGPRYRRQ